MWKMLEGSGISQVPVWTPLGRKGSVGGPLSQQPSPCLCLCLAFLGHPRELRQTDWSTSRPESRSCLSSPQPPTTLWSRHTPVPKPVPHTAFCVAVLLIVTVWQTSRWASWGCNHWSVSETHEFLVEKASCCPTSTVCLAGRAHGWALCLLWRCTPLTSLL